MKNDRSREIRVGALIAIGLVVIFAAFFSVGTQEGLFTQKLELKAKFGNVEGLTIGAPVRVGGVKVGSVSYISFAPEDGEKGIIVTMSIGADAFPRIRKDSFARLGSQGLLGDRTVDISIGSPQAEPFIQGEYVSTKEATQFDDLISKSGDALTDIKITAQNAKEISWKINHGNGSLAQIINDPRLYTNLDSLLNLWSRITVKINSGEGVLAKLVNDPSLYDNLTGTLSEMRTFLANVNSGQGSLGKMATDQGIYYRFDSLLTSLQGTLDKVNAGEGTAAQLVNNRDMYNKFNNTMDALNSLIIDIKQNPKKYVKLSLF